MSNHPACVWIFQSTRSQDRDPARPQLFRHSTISIHSVARPRHTGEVFRTKMSLFQSTRSQDRDLLQHHISMNAKYFNPLGRKTETGHSDIKITMEIFQSTRSQDRDHGVSDIFKCLDISIHSVARPRHIYSFIHNMPPLNFNPLGRKTETNIVDDDFVLLKFQSTRSQDRDCQEESLLPFRPSSNFNPLGRKTETAKLNNY